MNKEDFHRANEDTMSGNHITSATDATHLVVFQHGLLGSDNDFRNFVALFEKYFPAEHLYPYVTECNATHFSSLFLTYDGIETGGTRLADEIIAVASTLPHLKKFSVIGHSLGGLYARFAIGELFARNFFDNIEPMVCCDLDYLIHYYIDTDRLLNGRTLSVWLLHILVLDVLDVVFIMHCIMQSHRSYFLGKYLQLIARFEN